MTAYEMSDRTRLKRHPERGSYDRALVHGVLDEALVCHVGFVMDEQPYVLPMAHARVGETLYLHAAAGGRLGRALAGGVPLCVTVTLVDGLVLARSAFHHSMNYRSVVVLGRSRAVEGDEKARALEALVEHVAEGRSGLVRAPSAGELAGTAVIGLALEEVSAKVRTGPPVDREEDMDWPVWAGVVPVRTVMGEGVSG